MNIIKKVIFSGALSAAPMLVFADAYSGTDLDAMHQYGMMSFMGGSGGVWGLLATAFFLVWLAVGVLLVVWLWGKVNKK